MMQEYQWLCGIELGRVESRHLRRSAAWRALTRPIAASTDILLRPVVSRRRRSWTSFWDAILLVSRRYWVGWRKVEALRMISELPGPEFIMHALKSGTV